MKKYILPAILVVIGSAILTTITVLDHWITGHPSIVPFSHLAMEIGIALISAGLIGVLIETPGWSVYFSDRILEALIKPQFVAQLSDDVLDRYTKEVYAKKFGEHIKEIDSFYTFISGKTIQELKLAYREDYTVNINVEKSGNNLLYTKEISYKFSVLGHQTAPRKVEWAYEPDILKNVVVIDKIKFCYKNGDHVPECDMQIAKHRYDRKFAYFYWEIPPEIDVNGMTVKLKLNYETVVGHMNGFEFSYPMNKIKKITIKYPEGLTLRCLYFGIDELNGKLREQHDRTEQNGTVKEFSFEYADWCPKESGFAFQII